MATSLPCLTYFSLQGLGEPIRYTLALAEQEWTEVSVDYQAMKEGAGSVEWPFGQAPVFSDSEVQGLSQCFAIVRYLGRKYDLYGSNAVEASRIDMVLDGVKDVHSKYMKAIYTELPANDDPHAVVVPFVELHCSAAGLQKRNGGAHFKYLQKILERSGTGFFVGGKHSIADIGILFLVSLFIDRPLWTEHLDFKKEFLALAEHHAMMMKQPGIQKFLASSYRYSQINGNTWG